MSVKEKLIYPLENEQPLPAQLKEVAAGVYWLRMPLPFALDHINLWVLEDELNGQKGWTLIDTGIAKEPVKALWEQVFAQQLKGLPVLRVVVTHMHPDHVGLAGWLCERWQVPLYMSLSDYLFSCLWTSSARSNEQLGGSGGAAAAAHFARHGLVDEVAQQQVLQRGSYYADLVTPPPSNYRRLMDGDELVIGGKSWKTIVGYGHAPEHMALYCADQDVLISGDMVLPRISTNVSVFDYEPEADPLRLYLQSLTRYLELPSETLVLPSHGRPFVGLHVRIAELQAHHKDRLAETLEACRAEGGCSAAQLIPVLFKRELDMHQLTFAMGEAIAHLHALYFQKQVERRVNDQGIYQFYAVKGGQ